MAKAKRKSKAGTKNRKTTSRPQRPAAPPAQPPERGDPPKLVHVKKGADVLPVQIGSWAQFDRLVADHGKGNVEVQP